MFCRYFNLKSQRVISIFLMSVVMLLSFIPTVFAVPGTSEDVPGNVSNLGWIDLSANVPEGFSGSVFVQIRNVADDSYYDIECFVLNNFKNSKQIPLGNYEVVAVNTSENPFLYYASCDAEEFELTNSYSLNVVVQKVSDSETVLAESIENIEVSSEPTTDDKPNNSESVDSPTDKKPDGVKDESSDDVSDEKSSQDSKEGNSTKSPYSLLISFVISLLSILVVGFILWKIKSKM